MLLAEKIFTWRYQLLGAIFIFLVALNANFSSIHMWNTLVPNAEPAFKIGKARDIRTDEWATNLPIQMSQDYNKYQTYNYYAQQNGLNTLIAQSQAGFNLENIGRPYNWGFLLFGKARGLSWYWCLKNILLFLSSIEFVYFLTRNKSLSLFGAFIISFAPGVQWWASNYIPELITAFQLIIVLLYNFLQKDSQKKLILSVLLLIFSIGFVFVIYPPWQIPLAYIFLAFAGAIFYELRIKRTDLILLSIILFMWLFVVIHFFFLYSFDIGLMANTLYPGMRHSESGALSIVTLMNYLVTLKTPYISTNYSNACELSNFWCLFPVFPFICFSISSQERGKYFNIILYANLFILAFMLIPQLGFTTFYKVTLLSQVTGSRLLIIFGLLNTYLFILFLQKFTTSNLKLTAINAAVWIYVALWLKTQPLLYGYMHKWLYLSIIISWLIIHLVLTNKKKLALITFSILTFLIGVVVNPLTIGIGDLYNSNLSKKFKLFVYKIPMLFG